MMDVSEPAVQWTDIHGNPKKEGSAQTESTVFKLSAAFCNVVSFYSIRVCEFDSLGIHDWICADTGGFLELEVLISADYSAAGLNFC